MISYWEFCVCMGIIGVAAILCGWMAYRTGWLRGVKNQLDFEKRVDQARRERGELPYDYFETDSIEGKIRAEMRRED